MNEQKPEIHALLAEELTKLTNDRRTSLEQRTVGRRALAHLMGDQPENCDFSLYILAYYRLGVGEGVAATKADYDRAVRFAALRTQFHEAYGINAA